MRKNAYCNFLSGGSLPPELNYQPIASELIIDVTQELMSERILPQWFNPSYQSVYQVFDFIPTGDQQQMSSFGIAFDYPEDIGPRFSVSEVYTILCKNMYRLGLQVNIKPDNIIGTVEWLTVSIINGVENKRRVLCYSVLCTNAFFGYGFINSLTLFLSDFDWNNFRMTSKSFGIIQSKFLSTKNSTINKTCCIDLKSCEYKITQLWSSRILSQLYDWNII